MFIRLLRFIRGTVSFKVEGGAAERFLNLLVRSGVPVFNIRYSKDGFIAATFVKKYFRIRPLVRKTHVRVSLQKRSGLPFLIKKYSKRAGLIIGVFVFASFVFASGEFVWEIKINGNETISDQAILETLEEFGLTRGRWKRSLDVQRIAIGLRQSYEQIGWAAVNLVGSVAEIEIDERIESKEVPNGNSPCNIVASHEGQIVYMDVYDGQKVRGRGDAVKKGELIVSGVVKSPSKGKTILRHAAAKVMAEYPESFQAAVPLKSTLKVPTGPLQNYRYLKIGSVEIPLFLLRSKQEVSFERVFTRPIKILGVPLPFDMAIRQVIPAQMQEITLTPEKAQELAMKQLDEFERRDKSREVVKRSVRRQMTDGKLILHADYIFRQDIAKEEPILVDGSRLEAGH